MKIFLANSMLSCISRIFVYSPIVVAIILSINNSNFIVEFIVVGLFLSYIIYSCNFCWYMGVLDFKRYYL